MKKLLLLALLAIMETACTTGPPPDLKSPCVGAAGSPCARRDPADQWMS